MRIVRCRRLVQGESVLVKVAYHTETVGDKTEMLGGKFYLFDVTPEELAELNKLVPHPGPRCVQVHELPFQMYEMIQATKDSTILTEDDVPLTPAVANELLAYRYGDPMPPELAAAKIPYIGFIYCPNIDIVTKFIAPDSEAHGPFCEAPTQAA